MMTKYRLWHVAQVPGNAFEVESVDLKYLLKLQAVLADYDDFLLHENLKQNYGNSSGIDSRVNGGWVPLDEFEIQELIGGSIELAL